MNSKKKSLRQKLIDDPVKGNHVNDMTEPSTFPLPDCSSVEEKFKSMGKNVKDVELENSGIKGYTPFSISGDKVVYHVRDGEADYWKTIKVMSLETYKILRTFQLFDPKSDEPDFAEATFEHFSQIVEVNLGDSS